MHVWQRFRATTNEIFMRIHLANYYNYIHSFEYGHVFVLTLSTRMAFETAKPAILYPCFLRRYKISRIDLMDNDVKEYFSARTCILVVVVAHESNMASYFPEAGNFNGRNADMCSDLTGPPSSGSGDLFDLSDKSNTTYFYYFLYY